VPSAPRLVAAVIALLVAALPLPAGARNVRPTAQKPKTGQGQRRRLVVHAALAQRGVPYVWGGTSRHGFDCSGLVRFAYARIGLRLPHSSYALASVGRRVARSALRPADLIFFNGDGHVGIYIGDGRFVHAPHAGTVVRIERLSERWYASSYVGARRLLPADA
jgi:cell wall-associated NlpC family hydrolase